MGMRVLRRRQREKSSNRVPAALTLTLRAHVPHRSGVRALYPSGVAGEKRVDRDAWARVVKALMADATRGKIAPFARQVGVDPRTVSRWLAGTVDVSEESVRSVADAVHVPAMRLLVDVGYYSHTELAPAGDRDEELELVRDDPRLSSEKKVEIINFILERRERERAAALEETRRMIELMRDNG